MSYAPWTERPSPWMSAVHFIYQSGGHYLLACRSKHTILISPRKLGIKVCRGDVNKVTCPECLDALAKDVDRTLREQA